MASGKPLATEEPDERIVHKRSSPFGISAAIPLGSAQQSLWDQRSNPFGASGYVGGGRVTAASTRQPTSFAGVYAARDCSLKSWFTIVGTASPQAGEHLVSPQNIVDGFPYN